MTKNVLVFPGGSEIAMEIRNSLGLNKSVQLFGCSGDRFDAGPLLFENYSNRVPSISEKDACIAELNRLISKWGIHYIFPAHDSVGLFLSERRDNLNCRVLLPMHESVEVLRSKRGTIEALRGLIPVPHTYGIEEAKKLLSNGVKLFVKPDIGQGSLGAQTLTTVLNLDAAVGSWGDVVIQEHLPGDEYTVDCVSDRSHSLLVACPRLRRKMKSGIAVYTELVEDDEFEKIASVISERFRLVGCWFFQVKRSAEGELKLLEVAPRVSGSMGLYRQRGINFPLLSLLIHEGVSVSIAQNTQYRPVYIRTLANHFSLSSEFQFSRVYVDFDDTLVVRDKVNVRLVGLLYQWINEGKKIYLITRHAGNLTDALNRHRLTGLFDGIITLDRSVSKAEFVEDDSVFIDDSFRERQSVANKLGIPTFDTSMLECLRNEQF